MIYLVDESWNNEFETQLTLLWCYIQLNFFIYFKYVQLNFFLNKYIEFFFEYVQLKKYKLNFFFSFLLQPILILNKLILIMYKVVILSKINSLRLTIYHITMDSIQSCNLSYTFNKFIYGFVSYIKMLNNYREKKQAANE